MNSGLPPLIVLAAGGTGGHIFPAEALGRSLLLRNVRVVLVTDRRGGQFSAELAVPVHRLYAGTLGGNIVRKLRGIMAMAVGYMQARLLLRRLKPTAVVGFGGYPSVTTIMAAAMAQTPILLHEQNAVLGRANRLLMGQARLLATGFPHVSGIAPSTKLQLVHTGNPVRPAFRDKRKQPYPELSTEGNVHLLIMGGSQGARIFSDVVPQAMGLLPEALRRRLMLSQQCRAEDIERTRAAFAAVGMEPELATFFKDVPERLQHCHLAICRAGASTIAELTMVGRPAILVPYPFGHAGEQAANAEAVAEAGGAWVIPQAAFTPEALAVRIEALLTAPATLQKTAMAARQWAMEDAADSLADAVMQVIGLEAMTMAGSA